MKDSFATAEIRAAFWEYFHKSGEHYFDYVSAGSTEKECEKCTQESFDEFMEALNKPAAPAAPAGPVGTIAEIRAVLGEAFAATEITPITRCWWTAG